MFSRIKNFGELVVFEHTIFSSAFALIAMIVASTHKNGTPWFGFETLGLCVIALITARNFAMSFNRYCDIDIDRDNPRTQNRPSVDGRIQPYWILVFCVINAMLFILIAYLINPLALNLSLPFLFVLAFYSLLKRFSSLAHFFLGLALALAPLAGVIAVSGGIPAWSVYLALGVAFWVAGFDLFYSLQDMEFDKARGLFSVPARYGVNATLWLSAASHILACALWGIFIYKSNGGIFAYMGLMCAIAMLIYEHYLVRKDLLNIPKAFFQTNGYLGFVFLIFILVDNLL